MAREFRFDGVAQVVVRVPRQVVIPTVDEEHAGRPTLNCTVNLIGIVVADVDGDPLGQGQVR
jgi:hypothetical protein